jgi:hypothetical protein
MKSATVVSREHTLSRVIAVVREDSNLSLLQSRSLLVRPRVALWDVPSQYLADIWPPPHIEGFIAGNQPPDSQRVAAKK